MSEDTTEGMVFMAVVAGVVLFFYLFNRFVLWDFRRERRSALESSAAASGSAQARYALALELARGDARDARRAVELFSRAAEGGHAAAMACLGECYMSGHGVEQDTARAVELWQRSAHAGCTAAVTALADCYLDGTGLPQDEKRAVRMYRSAAEKFDADAAYKLARCYLLGRGVPENRRAAEKWLQQAIMQHHHEAMLLSDELSGNGEARNRARC